MYSLNKDTEQKVARRFSFDPLLKTWTFQIETEKLIVSGFKVFKTLLED